jgi:hypothetical protein
MLFYLYTWFNFLRTVPLDKRGHAMTRLHSLVVVLLMFAQLHPTSVDEQASQETNPLKAHRAAISECVADVRRQKVSSKFDMHLTQAGELRGWGSDHDVYLFSRCMEKRGYDVQGGTKENGAQRREGAGRSRLLVIADMIERDLREGRA